MRVKAQAIFDFGWAEEADNQTVRDYRNEYKSLSEILDRHPAILDRAHDDLATLCKATTKRGRKPTFTSENLFRAILVMQREGMDYRQASVRIAESETLQWFCRLIKKPTLDFTLLNKAFCAIRPETWEGINRALATRAASEGAITPSHVRTDTTVTECNIHWPTDSSLLWDVYRVVARQMKAGRKLDRSSCPWRFHGKKIKQLDFFIARYGGSPSKSRRRAVTRKYRLLIERVEELLEKAERFIDRAIGSSCLELIAIGRSLLERLPVMRQVASVARRRIFDGEKVPNDDKVFSIFEPHTELIKRGRRGKPIEFGHKLLLTQSREKFITDYVVLEKNRLDSELLPMVIERHEDRFGAKPEVVAADKGFHPGKEKFEELADEETYLGVPARTRDFGDALLGAWQQWRAGVEGSISCLKRVFRLALCCFRGFNNFASAVGSAVFCHNLTILAKTSIA